MRKRRRPPSRSQQAQQARKQTSQAAAGLRKATVKMAAVQLRLKVERTRRPSAAVMPGQGPDRGNLCSRRRLYLHLWKHPRQQRQR